MKKKKNHLRLTCVAQKRLCLAHLVHTGGIRDPEPHSVADVRVRENTGVHKYGLTVSYSGKRRAGLPGRTIMPIKNLPKHGPL